MTTLQTHFFKFKKNKPKYSKDYNFLGDQTKALIMFSIMTPKKIITTET